MVPNRRLRESKNYFHGPFSITLLTIPEVAARLKVTVAKVDHWVSLGAIPCFSLDNDLRISEHDIATFIAAHRVLRNMPAVPANIPRDGTAAAKNSTPPRLMSIKDATRFLGIGRSTLYSMIGNNQLPTVKIGRRRMIRSEVLEQFVSALKG